MEEKKVESTEKVAEKKYEFKLFSRDEVITDPTIIDYYKISLREFIDKNKLVGKFDDNGKYYLLDEIKQDLVDMEKEIAEFGEGVFYASNSYMDKTFNFVVEIERLDNNKGEATLYLLEDYLFRGQRGTFKSFIASYQTDFDSFFNAKVKEVFNLVDSVRGVLEVDVPQLAILMQGQKDNGIFLDELIELGSQIYVLRMLEMLEKAGGKGQVILETFKKLQEQFEQQQGEPIENKEKKGKFKNNFDYQFKVNKRFTFMRALLDQVIEENGGFDKLPLNKEEVIKNLKDFIDPVKQVEKLRKTYSEMVQENRPKGLDKKKEPSKASGSKGSSGKSSGGSKVKKATKKADKKSGEKKDKGKDDKKKGEKKKSGSYITKSKEEKNNKGIEEKTDKDKVDNNPLNKILRNIEEEGDNEVSLNITEENNFGEKVEEEIVTTGENINEENFTDNFMIEEEIN